jgi:hypothetical protein
MAALSVATVVLSMSDGCPGLPFYILEIIINTAMILEVGIRFVAFGRVSSSRKHLQPEGLMGLVGSNSGNHHSMWSI